MYLIRENSRGIGLPYAPPIGSSICMWLLTICCHTYASLTILGVNVCACVGDGRRRRKRKRKDVVKGERIMSKKTFLFASGWVCGGWEEEGWMDWGG